MLLSTPRLSCNAFTRLLKPSVSDSKMNSCRNSVHFWPTAVRKPIACSHSSGVRSTSRANECKCRTRLDITSLKRGSGVVDIWSNTASVIVFSLTARIFLTC